MPATPRQKSQVSASAAVRSVEDVLRLDVVHGAGEPAEERRVRQWRASISTVWSSIFLTPLGMFVVPLTSAPPTTFWNAATPSCLKASGFWLAQAIVHSTSSAVTGCPSLQTAAGFRWNVYFFASGLTSHVCGQVGQDRDLVAVDVDQRAEQDVGHQLLVAGAQLDGVDARQEVRDPGDPEQAGPCRRARRCRCRCRCRPGLTTRAPRSWRVAPSWPTALRLRRRSRPTRRLRRARGNELAFEPPPLTGRRPEARPESCSLPVVLSIDCSVAAQRRPEQSIARASPEGPR